MTSEYLTKWETPDSYFGYDPVDHFVLYSKTRDCSILTFSNYEQVLESVPKATEFRASCSMHGYIDYIILHEDEDLRDAEEIACALAECPILNDSDYSDRKYQAINNYFDNLTISERLGHDLLA